MEKYLCNIEKCIILETYGEMEPTMRILKLDEDNNLKYENMGFVKLDELMVPIIFLLNQKGYETSYCCSGHIDNPYGGYIAFKKPIFDDKDLKIDIKNNYPNLVVDEISSCKNSIIRVFDDRVDYDDLLSYEESVKIINSFCNELLDWAISLPEFCNTKKSNPIKIGEIEIKKTDCSSCNHFEQKYGFNSCRKGSYSVSKVCDNYKPKCDKSDKIIINEGWH